MQKSPMCLHTTKMILISSKNHKQHQFLNILQLKILITVVKFYKGYKQTSHRQVLDFWKFLSADDKK